MSHISPISPANARARARAKQAPGLRSAWIPAFAGTTGILGASPALAHEDHEHGLPGVLHPVSADHSGWAVLAAVVLLTLFACRRPILKALKVRNRK